MKAGKKFFNEIWIELTVDQRIYLTEYINKQKQDYARIQIENHLKEVKRLMNEKLKDFEGLNPEIENIIDNTPINLD